MYSGSLYITYLNTLTDLVEKIIINSFINAYVKQNVASDTIPLSTTTYKIKNTNVICFTIRGKQYNYGAPCIYDMSKCIYYLFKAECTRGISTSIYKQMSISNQILIETIINMYQDDVSPVSIYYCDTYQEYVSNNPIKNIIKSTKHIYNYMTEQYILFKSLYPDYSSFLQYVNKYVNMIKVETHLI